MFDKLAMPYYFRDSEIKNRLCALPMEANDAGEDGRPTEQTIMRYKNLSAGEWGIVYVEAIAPSANGKARKRQMVMSEENLDSFKRLVDEIKVSSDPPPFVILQINHAGRYGLAPMIAYHSEVLDPSWHGVGDITPATADELDAEAARMANAIRLAAQTGADAIDVKCCHGYLAAELLRPMNNRQDKYGGSDENRFRFFNALLEAAAEAERDFGTMFGARVSLHEHFPGGIGSIGPEGIEIDRAAVNDIVFKLKSYGAAFICITMGVPYFNPEFVRPYAGQKNKSDVLNYFGRLNEFVRGADDDIMVIGSAYTSYGHMFRLWAELQTAADIKGMGRQSFADPLFPKKLFGGDEESIRWCRCCKRNGCATLLRSNKEVGCVVFDDYYKKQLKQIK